MNKTHQNPSSVKVAKKFVLLPFYLLGLVIFCLATFKIIVSFAAQTNALTHEQGKELVVLAHGLGRSDRAMWRFAQRLENVGYKVCSLDYSSIGESVDAVIAETAKQIDACITQAESVHFVGHSLGGLVIRSYLQQNELKHEKVNVGKVVLIGTPNKGSEFADHLRDSWVMDIGGGVSRALVTGSNSLGNKLDASLKGDLGTSLGASLGVIAGTKSSLLTNKHFIGPNDGLVSVKSTKLKGMNDFIAIEVGHSMMRYNSDVCEQTINFLQKGSFKH